MGTVIWMLEQEGWIPMRAPRQDWDQPASNFDESGP
jgi:hypothetical protein